MKLVPSFFQIQHQRQLIKAHLNKLLLLFAYRLNYLNNHFILNTLIIDKIQNSKTEDTIKILCDKLQNKPNTPNSLANEMERALLKRNRNIINRKSRINESSIKNDLVKNNILKSV